MAGPERDPVGRSTRRTPARSRSASASRPTSTGPITGVRFYKATANTGTHVGNLWIDERDAARPRDVQRRERLGLAAADVHDPGRHHGGNDLRRVVLRAARALLGRRRSTTTRRAPSAGTRSTARRCTPSAPTAAAPTASTPTAGATTFPPSTFDGENYAVDVVFTPKLPPGAVSNVTATPGPGSATVSFAAPDHRRPAHALHRHPVHRLDGAALGHRDRQPAARPRSRSAASTRRPRTPSRSRPATAAAPARSRPRPTRSRRTPPTAPGAPTALVASAANQQATVRWTAPERRRAHDHPLHRHAVPRRRRAGHDRR